MEAGINRDLLPEVKPAGTVIGEISSKIMKELNFKIKAKLVSGAHDQIAAATGVGIIQPGMAVNWQVQWTVSHLHLINLF